MQTATPMKARRLLQGLGCHRFRFSPRRRLAHGSGGITGGLSGAGAPVTRNELLSIVA
jgi:hypothetical protein